MEAEFHPQTDVPRKRTTVPLMVPLLFVVMLWSIALAPQVGQLALQRANPLRAGFEQVHLGMTEEEVVAILGPPSDRYPPWEATPTHAELWIVEEGRVAVQEYGPPWKVYWLEADMLSTSEKGQRSIRTWSSAKTAVYVGFDNRKRVSDKSWFEERPNSPGVTKRVRSWFGF